MSTRTPNAYIFFLRKERPKVAKKHPGATIGEMAKIMGEIWRGMSDAKKKPYQAQAKRAASKATAAKKVVKKTSTPAKKTPVKKTAAKKTPTKKTPVKKTTTVGCGPKLTLAQYKQLTVPELKDIAKKMKVDGLRGLTKDKIAAKLVRANKNCQPGASLKAWTLMEYDAQKKKSVEKAKLALKAEKARINKMTADQIKKLATKMMLGDAMAAKNKKFARDIILANLSYQQFM